MHWITGRDGEDVAQVPAARLIAPAAVLDFTAEAAADPDFLLEIEPHQGSGSSEHGPLPEGGWLLYRTGWDARSHAQDEFLNANETGPHTPGGVGGVRPVAGRGVPGDRASGWRPWAPTPGRRTRSTRRSPATRRCSGRASTA